MNCRSAESLFSAFLDDELTQAERRHFESHLLGCRRCSQSVRELKGAMALVNDAVSVSAAETSPHFEDDLMDRIRSGEAMRPTVIEWLQGFLAPERLRPVFLVGASACAIFVAVFLFNGGMSSHETKTPAVAERSTGAPASDGTSASQTAPALSAATETPVVAPSTTTLASAVPDVARSAAPRRGDANGIVEIADRVIPTNRAELDSAVPNPDAQFVDEYVNDRFYLQRGGVVADPNQSSLVPVTDKGSDGVYIEF
ncbi:MAG TPA: zf-HC2 domain-containing protein [Candidatus Eisenbacteria bacterium]